ncbi:uncharacterized protein DAT39_018142 [Clarias magur]|uniref:Uncharacterized protein n=1 Tax=Clarias magur TaxID=1594786 RepID=A0A8J4X417_CLAMG|nr:uncharacterized protein DAT39_018142 [Clarias magur]
MEEQNIGRVLVLLLALLVYITALVINGLAGAGKGPFLHSTGNVSALYETEITPAGWTFSIWGIIYSWLLLMHIYFLSCICRRTTTGWMYCSPALPPYGFFISWMINMLLNIIWLLLWDRKFAVENFVIEKHVRYVLTVYPVVIVALSGILSKHYDAAAPGRNAVFSAVLLALACVFFAVRLALVIWRHRARPLSRDENVEGLMSPAPTTEN